MPFRSGRRLTSARTTFRETNTDSFLFKIGNRDIVRGMAECHEVLTLIDKEDTYANLYVDIAKEAGDIVDSYFWIDKQGDLSAQRAARRNSQRGFASAIRRIREGHAGQAEHGPRQTRQVTDQAQRDYRGGSP